MCSDPNESAVLASSTIHDPWQWWRSQMPVTRRWAYFDHAAVAPLPTPTAQAIQSFADQAACQGDVDWLQWAGDVEDMRRSIADWLHVQPLEIAMIPNTSFGINIVAQGLDWQPGDNVVVPRDEFPSNLFPWLQQKDRGVEVRLIGSSDVPPTVDEFSAAIDQRTRVVTASWVGYASGHRLEIEKLVQLSHDRGALFFLDAIQGLGVFPLNLRDVPIDFLAADGHKWLLGPEGAGLAFIRQCHLERLRCPAVGWNSVKQAHLFGEAQFDLKASASRFEAGSANMIGLQALHQSLQIFWKIQQDFGIQAIADRVLGLADQAERLLHAAGADTALPRRCVNRSGIVPFNVAGIDPAGFRKLALQHGVVVSCRGGKIRASIHAYNNLDDLQKLAYVVSLISP